MDFNTREVKAKIASFNSIEEKRSYLTEQIRLLKKRIAEFKAVDKIDLDVLKKLTEKDFEAYLTDGFKGLPIYWHEGSKYEHLNEQQAKQAGIKNHVLLRKRLNLEYTYSLLKADLKIWKLLEAELNEAGQPQPVMNSESRTKNLINEAFEGIDNKGWKYAFNSESDYFLFVNLLTGFFEYESYLIPETRIRLKKGCKTKMAKVLGSVYGELTEKKLISDEEYFKIIKVLSVFENETKHDLYKALTR